MHPSFIKSHFLCRHATFFPIEKRVRVTTQRTTRRQKSRDSLRSAAPSPQEKTSIWACGAHNDERSRNVYNKRLPHSLLLQSFIYLFILYLFIYLFILESKSTNISFLPRPPLHVGPGDSSYQRGKGYPSGLYVYCRCNLSTPYRPSFPDKKEQY